MNCVVDIAKECLKQSQCKVEKYCQSMAHFGASYIDINKVTGGLAAKNKDLADLLLEIEVLQEKVKTLEEMEKERQQLHYEQLVGVAGEAGLKEDIPEGTENNSKSQRSSCASTVVPNTRRKRHSLLVSQMKKSLRPVETSEFVSIPAKTRGRIGRLELNQLLRKLDEAFSEKYGCQKYPPLTVKNVRKESEKVRGRCYVMSNELRDRFTAKEKVSWRFALPCLIYLKRLEEVQDGSNAFIVIIES